MKTVIITGASGYIGGQTAIKFASNNWKVVGIDCKHPPKHLETYFSKFMISDCSSEESLYLIQQTKPDAIVHCGGTSLVGPSIKNPAPYYQNNFVATKVLLDFLVENKIDAHVVFSSSASVYGEPIMPPCMEEDPPLPLSPYGESKLMVEMMLKSYAHAYGLKYTAFRYFNVCGADSEGRHGQAPGATHIIARIMESITKEQDFTLNGNDYPTPDGTCIRDYVHVDDIAQAHLLATEKSTFGLYNLSTGTGNSNKEIVDNALASSASNISINKGPGRPGDPAVLTGSSKRFANETGWKPKHNLESIIKTAWNWYTRDVS